ncbi:hypothetical protein ALC57_11207 [Trachymyrmex cornetzi]|uniref:Mos1 transposase HTH domain-containing protein n=1 Tax=Trachymyrmex cornetzi TaxID=471704 RepID=A0A151J2U7_9HYME|nr:hypothetical protein ALC57_11207 [Trachymyrmex cornetzi]
MEKIEYRAIIKFLHLKGNTSTQIKAELDAVYGDSAPSFATVKRWVIEFKRGRTSLADGERSGRPTTATTTDNIEEIHQMIMDNRRIKIREIAEAVCISKERVCHILTKELGMRKLTARWVPRLLTWTYYASLLDKLMAKIHELRFELIDHPPYSLDLAPSDFFLFPRLKIWLGGQKFSSNEEVIASIEAYFAKQDAQYYLNGLKG